MNDFSVTINGHDYANAVFPFKYGDFLDEQLDYATLTLSQVSPEVYAPLTPVYITITSNGTNGVQSKSKTYLIAEDSAYETPNGSGYYRHELMLIEETKYLEGFMVESLCVTNAGGRNYVMIDPTQQNYADFTAISFLFSNDNKTPLITGTQMSLPDIVPYENTSGIIDYTQTIKVFLTNAFTSFVEKEIYSNTTTNHTGTVPGTIEIYSGINILTYTYTVSFTAGGRPTTFNYKSSFTIYGQPNHYPLKPWTIKEVINRALELTEPLIWDKSAKNYVVPPRFHFDYKTKQTTTATETVQARISAYNPLVPTFYKKVDFTEGHIIGAKVTSTPPKVSATVAFTGDSYTITGSTINVGDYEIGVELTYADGEEVELFEQNSPEFTFTRATLRELLQAIGGYIHAEPRLKGDTIVFDRYGGQELARYYDVIKQEITDLKEYNYSGKTVRYGIEQACTRIDSYVDNLVNQISATPATVGQPHNNGYQSVRTDSAYLRFEENDSTIFPTAYPILQIHKLYWVDTSGSAVTKDKYDITPYVFEKSIYDSQLSSYTDVYPSSKAYGLYYTQGQKNIGGFFFKEPNARGPVFEQYAIVNILRTVTGNPNLTIDKTNYTKLCFELEYIPVYSARVGHGKQYVGDWLKFPRTLAHNQSGNMVETQYYGENIKGTAERLGTIEKSYTFTAFNLNTIPEAGQLWDEDYYIATVSVEVNQDRFRCTVGLSKNFNRISQYIGANSYRRIFEVSERMVQERQSIYTDYLVITDKAAPVPAFRENFLCNNANFYDNLLSEFYGESVSQICGKVSAVFIRGETKNGKETLPKIILPVISSAFGNVMEFSWEFKDNFSAGMRAVEVTSGNITGTFGQEVQYCDYYGRMYYENFELWSIFDNDISYGAEMSYPLLEKYVADSEHAYYVAHTNTGYPLIKRKDSREALKENYAIEFVTDVKGVVVGSALASTNPLVSGLKTKEKAVFVILNRPINKFSRKINMSAGNIAARYEIGANGFDISRKTYVDENRMGSVYLECTGTTATVAGKAWAFMTPVYEGEPYTVEDEDGNVSTITPKYGGELLFGRNIDIKNGDNVGAFRIVGTHDVFDYLKQKEALI
nr:MAG TPA: hypothetical protein [Caudoviricetes sp.]